MNDGIQASQMLLNGEPEVWEVALAYDAGLGPGDALKRRLRHSNRLFLAVHHFPGKSP